MKNIKLLLLLLVLTGVSSCKKTETTTIKVTAINDNTKQGIPNISVRIYESQKGSFLTSATGQLFDEGITDANGVYYFGEVELKKDKKYTYIIETSFSREEIIKGEYNDIITKKYPRIGIRLKLRPPPPYNTGDTLKFTMTNAGIQYENFTRRYSIYSYDSTNITGLPAGWQYVNIDKYKSGVYSNIRDTVNYLGDGDVFDYIINW